MALTAAPPTLSCEHRGSGSPISSSRSWHPGPLQRLTTDHRAFPGSWFRTRCPGGDHQIPAPESPLHGRHEDTSLLSLPLTTILIESIHSWDTQQVPSISDLLLDTMLMLQSLPREGLSLPRHQGLEETRADINRRANACQILL